MTKNDVRDWCFVRRPFGTSNFEVCLKRLIFSQQKKIQNVSKEEKNSTLKIDKLDLLFIA